MIFVSYIPHHFGYTFEGKKVGEHCNVLTSHEDLEELTGNPYGAIRRAGSRRFKEVRSWQM